MSRTREQVNRRQRQVGWCHDVAVGFLERWKSLPHGVSQRLFPWNAAAPQLAQSQGQKCHSSKCQVLEQSEGQDCIVFRLVCQGVQRRSLKSGSFEIRLTVI